MGDHPVGRPHAQPVDVPRAHQDLDGLDHREGARGPQRFDRRSDLGDRGDVEQEDPARNQRGGRVPDHAPRLGHVEDEAVDRSIFGQHPGVDVRAAQHQRIRGPEKSPDVLFGDPGKLVA